MAAALPSFVRHIFNSPLRLNFFQILHKLVEGGNTVVVIEHNLDVIKVADYIIDMGPDGGDRGGTVVVSGTPEEVAKHKTSYTAKYVRKELKKQ